MQTLLASDIDNTLTGDRPALDRLRAQIDALRGEGRLALFLSTGRRIEQVLDGQAREGVPEADAVISQVGTEIYLPPFSPSQHPLEDWERRLASGFDRSRIVPLLDGIEGLRMQEGIYNTPLKISYYVDPGQDPELTVERVRRRVGRAAVPSQVVWSSGRHLDVLPSGAGKGNAIRFALETLGLAPDRVIVAGDSGNDVSMFDAFRHGIVVGNAQPELKAHARERSGDGSYIAAAPYAAGVYEGLEHFRVLTGEA